MDEELPDLKSGDKLPKEDEVYRIVEDSRRDKENKFIPSQSCFSLTQKDKEDGYGLSTDWNRKTTPEESVARFGAMHKHTRDGSIQFKPYRNREIYAFEISFLETLLEINEVVYNPISNDPPISGSPNNPSHSLIMYKIEDFEKNEPILIVKLRNHAKDKKIDVNMDEVEKLVEAYRNV